MVVQTPGQDPLHKANCTTNLYEKSLADSIVIFSFRGAASACHLPATISSLFLQWHLRLVIENVVLATLWKH